MRVGGMPASATHKGGAGSNTPDYGSQAIHAPNGAHAHMVVTILVQARTSAQDRCDTQAFRYDAHQPHPDAIEIPNGSSYMAIARCVFTMSASGSKVLHSGCRSAVLGI